MTRGKIEETVNSYRRSGDLISFEVIREKDGKRLLYKKNMNLEGVTHRWKCGCGEMGPSEKLSMPLILLLRSWQIHLNKVHPDYKL